MGDLGLHLEQEARIEIIIFGAGDVVAGKAADRRLVLPQGEHLDMDDVALLAMQAPGAAVALGRAIVGQADRRHQLKIFRRLRGRNPAMPSPRDHRYQQPSDLRHDQWRMDPPGRHAAESVDDRFEQQGEIVAERVRLGEDLAMVDVLSHLGFLRPPWRGSGFGRRAPLPRGVELDLVEHPHGWPCAAG